MLFTTVGLLQFFALWFCIRIAYKSICWLLSQDVDGQSVVYDIFGGILCFATLADISYHAGHHVSVFTM